MDVIIFNVISLASKINLTRFDEEHDEILLEKKSERKKRTSPGRMKYLINIYDTRKILQPI